MSLTPDLDRLEAIARQATPGPWRKRYDGHGDLWIEVDNGIPPANRQETAGHLVAVFDAYINPEDLDFVSTFDPAVVLALIHLARKAS